MRKLLVSITAVISILIVTFAIVVINGRAIPINQAITLDSRAGNHINVVVDEQGIVHVAYDAEVSGTDQIFYTNNRNGDFSTPVSLGAGIDPGLSVSSNGSVHIAWYEVIETFSAKLWYASASSTGNFTASSLGTYDDLDNVAIGVYGNTVHIVYNARATGYFFALSNISKKRVLHSVRLLLCPQILKAEQGISIWL